jgi:hypothetical protein
VNAPDALDWTSAVAPAAPGFDPEHFGAIAANPKIDLVVVCDTDPGELAVAVAGADDGRKAGAGS